MNIASQIIDRVGGTRKMAQITGNPPSTVQSWKAAGQIPAERIIEIEAATGIPREELRPDLYRPASAA